MIEYDRLTSHYLLEMFPEFEKEIRAQTEFLGQELLHCIYAGVFNPFLKGYFKNHDLKDRELAIRIFEFYEDLAAGDFETANLLQVSLLEPLWDSRECFLGAQYFMGDKTKAVWNGISSYLNEPQ